METKSIIIPVLPVKNAVFFPKTLLPLYLNKEKLKTMLNDSLKSSKFIGIYYCKDGSLFNSFEESKIFSLLTLGKIIDNEIDPEGNMSVIIEGIKRVKYEKTIQTQPYILASVISSLDEIRREHDKQLEEGYFELITIVEEMKYLFQGMHGELINRIKNISAGNPGLLADLIAFYFVADNYDKQCILNELNILRRIQLTTIQIKLIINRFKSKKLKIDNNNI